MNDLWNNTTQTYTMPLEDYKELLSTINHFNNLSSEFQKSSCEFYDRWKDTENSLKDADKAIELYKSIGELNNITINALIGKVKELEKDNKHLETRLTLAHKISEMYMDNFTSACGDISSLKEEIKHIKKLKFNLPEDFIVTSATHNWEIEYPDRIIGTAILYK